MSRSPQLYPEDQQDIFVAIPPPLVSPLARQLSSSHHGTSSIPSVTGIDNSNNPQQLVTPTTSTDNSFEQWTSFEPMLLQQHQLQLQQQRAIALLGGDRTGAGGSSRTTAGGSSSSGGGGAGLSTGQLPPMGSLSRMTLDSNATTTTGTNRPGFPLNTPVSSPPLPLPVQLLNRLYPFSAMGAGGANPSADSSCASSTSGSYTSRNLMSGIGVSGSGVGVASGGYGSRSSSSLHHQQPDMLAARRNSTELARTAAATAIVNTLVSRGSSGGGSGSGGEVAAGLSIPRGDSPYIPSSLSMLFSDPDIMQVQDEVEHYNNIHQQQQHQQQGQQQQQHQQQRRMSNSQLTHSHSGSGGGSGIFVNSEDGDRDGREDHEEDDGAVYGEESRLLQDTAAEGRAENAAASIITNTTTTTTTTTTGTGAGAGMGSDGYGYGYEIVQEDPQDDVFRPYVAMMARDDYLAPHQPSSSSPLFPSPLTTLGGFSYSGTSMLDVAEDQQAQAAGRIWRDYGTMMENGQFRQQHHNAPTAAQSHAAYYHAVSNYHYSYNTGNPNDGARAGEGSSSSASGSGSGSTSQVVNPCVPTGHYAIPESWQWRRQRGRGASHQSYGSANAGANASGNGGTRRRNGGDGSEDHWLWGILASVVSCWVCCESPAACCSCCCL
ncbi:MAG: hypothetical protein J3R72DRAFT_436908 [Linnemannia gamsii]|nr:MAG: hypothetical protein J3R72DRAFT_436908 [Linnemannia gamsii]